MFKRPVFWLVAVVVCVLSSAFSIAYFPRAFPLVSLDIRMDREAALAAAGELAERHGWGPEGYSQAASFGLEPQVQEFIELEGGGREAFREALARDDFHPYRWRVRHFREMERNETLVTFAPGGAPYGFREQLAEDAPGAALDGEAALAIAERSATGDWDIDLAEYTRIESSQEAQPGGRMDHTFVYERNGVSFGEGRLRLRLVVGGDALTELTRYLEIPEAFARRYAEMRSTNDVIGAMAQIVAFLGYIFGGCAVALFFLFRDRWVLWKRPLMWGLFVAFLQMLVVFNQLPLAWMGYDTALSSTNFMLQQIGLALLIFLVLAGLFTATFMAAESMTRRAFPQHVQLWRVWSPGVANTPTIAGQTAIGYLLLGVFFAYEVFLYFVAQNWLGWWSPTSNLAEPDLLATYFPWLTAVAVSFQAGFWEECLFRAVPIAGAALLGKRYGRPGLWIAAAFIVQALVFGAGHAPYPSQPAYARVVELIIPSLGFGLIYLYMGLLPGIVLHYAFDVIWFAMPLFAVSAPGAWIDRTILIVLALAPVAIVLVRFARAGGWAEIPAAALNGAWQPPPVSAKVDEAPAAVPVGTMGPAALRLLPVAGIVGLVLWFAFGRFETMATPIEAGRAEAIAAARQELQRRNIELSPEWRTLASVATTAVDQQHRFVWQEGGADAFSELRGDYLRVPRWAVRFARFRGDVAERAEEYGVVVDGDGEVFRFIHTLPEARPGADLGEEEARQIAGREVRASFGLAFGDPSEPGAVREISAETFKRPERRDWVFTFEDPAAYSLERGSARVRVDIAGDEVTQSQRFVYVPEEWARADRDRQVVPDALGIVTGIIGALVVLSGAVAGGMAWARGRFSAKTFTVVLLALLGIGVFEFVNGWPAVMAGLSNAMPIGAQVVILIAGISIAVVAIAVAVALLAGWLHRLQWDSGVQSPTLARSLWVGAALGLFVAGLRAALAAAGPSLAPPWGSYDTADAFLPWLGTVQSPLTGYVTTTLFLLLVFTFVGRRTGAWSRRTGIYSALLLLLGLMATANSPAAVWMWALSGLLVGAAIIIGYRFVLRYDLTVLPAAVAAAVILGQIRQGALGSHPAALSGGIGAAVVIAAIAILWTWQLRRGCETTASSAATVAAAACR